MIPRGTWGGLSCSSGERLRNHQNMPAQTQQGTFSLLPFPKHPIPAAGYNRQQRMEQGKGSGVPKSHNSSIFSGWNCAEGAVSHPQGHFPVTPSCSSPTCKPGHSQGSVLCYGPAEAAGSFWLLKKLLVCPGTATRMLEQSSLWLQPCPSLPGSANRHTQGCDTNCDTSCATSAAL